MNKDMRKGFRWGLGAAIVGVAIAWLLGFVHCEEKAQKDRLAELHEAELKACMAEYGNCRIEYLKDRTDTIYAAKVVRGEE